MMDIRKRIMARLKYEKEHPVRTFLKNLFWRWPVHVLPRKIRDTYYNIKCFFQRHVKGFSDEDIFCADDYITETLAKILDAFLESRTGYPYGMTDKEYEAKIKRISNAFKSYTLLADEKTKEINALAERHVNEEITYEEYHVLVKEIHAKYDKLYDEAFETMGELFKDGFICTLWD